MADRALIIDNHVLARTAIRALLVNAAGIESIGEAESLEDGLARAHRDTPNVILLGLPLGKEVVPAIGQLHQAAPNARIIVLSLYDHPAYENAAIAAGAHAYVQRDRLDAGLMSEILSPPLPATGGRISANPDAE